MITSKKIFILSLVVLFSLAGLAWGADCCPKSGTMQTTEAGQQGMDMSQQGAHHMDGMQAMGGMIMLEKQTVDGITAMVHLKDVREAMQKVGMEQTHHFMVMFSDAQTHEARNEGTVAVKIIDPAGTEQPPLKLMGMMGHFGADISLPEKGTYTFVLGTKLGDGQKRQFTFTYEQK